MTLSNDEMEFFCFRFLNDEIPLNDFEQWIYATPELENYWGEAAYFELASFNFRQPAAKYEFFKLMDTFMIPARFYTWQVKQFFQGLLDGTLDPVEVFEKIYKLYNDGYMFLDDIGIQYVTFQFDEIPKQTQQHLWREEEYNRRRKLLDEYLPPLKEEIKLLLDALESGDLKIISRDKCQLEPALTKN